RELIDMNPPHDTNTERSTTSRADLVCLSHLRWNFVFQRPQHLMTRFASERRVFFVEEPLFDSSRPQLAIRRDGDVRVVVPHLPAGMSGHASSADSTVATLLSDMYAEWPIAAPICWHYTPMALP